MSRTTRTGRIFSEWCLDGDPFTKPAEIIHTGVDLSEYLQEALAAADRRAAAQDEGLLIDPNDEGWEDIEDVDSRPPSPLSDLTESPPPTRSTSPIVGNSTTAVDSSSAYAPAQNDSDSDDDLDMPPIVAHNTAPIVGDSTTGVDSPSMCVDSDTPAQSDSNLDGDPDMPPLVPHQGVHARRRRENKYAHRNRLRDAAATRGPYDRPIRAKYSQAHREQAIEETAFDTSGSYKSSAGAWIGARPPRKHGRGKGKAPSRRVRTLSQLKKSGFRHIRWDGRSPKLIVDVHGQIIAILLGRPEDDGWDNVVADAFQAMDRVRRAGRRSGAFRARDSVHRRGRFTLLASGVSFGGGQSRPGNLVNSRKRQKLINYLLANKSIGRLAGFQSSGLAHYAPKLWRYCRDTLRALFKHHHGLKHNFNNSIFPAATFNCGPDVVTAEHMDFLNLVHGLCAITSGGDFDHTEGGQIYLDQIKLVIDFPSGAGMLIPSAFVTHGNTPIRPNETRFSLTQYAAGALFRWVKYGFRTAKSVLASEGGADLLATLDGAPGSRWQWAMDLFSKPEELEADRRAALSSLDM